MTVEVESAYNSNNCVRMASSRSSRLPFQPRSVASTNSCSTESSDDYLSKGTKSSSTTAESSSAAAAKEHRRLSSGGSRNSGDYDGVAANGPIPSSFQEPQRMPAPTSSGRPALARASSAPEHDLCQTLDPSSFSSGNKDEIIIEEKRRRSKGQEGYTIHRYRRGKMLGKGGFAKVYMCTALDSGKDYAVKIVPKANLVKARARQKVSLPRKIVLPEDLVLLFSLSSLSPFLQLQAEIKIHRTLKHKHVCEYKHFFEDKTNCYILLELCHNQSMNEMIKRRKRLTEPEAAFFMQDMIGAVKYMHENFVIHRDLKLGNLFLDKNMHIKVGDLGLATRLEKAEEKRKTICGTPNYIAPEVIQGTKETRGHSYEVDIWSMGVILYTMLIGKPPYEAKDVKATYKRIIANEYDFPVHTPISPQARDLIAAMLQSRPEQRYVITLLIYLYFLFIMERATHAILSSQNFRPTLDEISQHAFFNDGVQIPLFLPSSATQIAPTWMHDEIGQLVPRPIESEENDSNSSKNDSSTATLPSMARGGSVRRLPLKNKDPNINNYGSDEYKKPVQLNDWFNPPPGMVQSAVAAASVKQSTAGALQFERRNKPEIQPAFRVFDETGASSKRSSSGRMDGLVSQTSNLRLNDDAERAPVEKPLPVDSDAEVLLLMLERLTTVLEVSKQSEFMYAASQVKAASRGAPIKWITRYVDYTSKYGLGFLMNDGR